MEPQCGEELCLLCLCSINSLHNCCFRSLKVLTHITADPWFFEYTCWPFYITRIAHLSISLKRTSKLFHFLRYLCLHIQEEIQNRVESGRGQTEQWVQHAPAYTHIFLCAPCMSWMSKTGKGGLSFTYAWVSTFSVSFSFYCLNGLVICCFSFL